MQREQSEKGLFEFDEFPPSPLPAAITAAQPTFA
jgi:hypothetical protein